MTNNKHMKRYTALLTIVDTQIKTTVRYYLVRVVIIKDKQTESNKCWQECGEIGTLVHC